MRRRLNKLARSLNTMADAASTLTARKRAMERLLACVVPDAVTDFHLQLAVEEGGDGHGDGHVSAPVAVEILSAALSSAVLAISLLNFNCTVSDPAKSAKSAAMER